MTLLEAARASGIVPRGKRNAITDETIELALAWARGEIGIAAINHAIGSKPASGGGSAAYSLLARSLAEHVRRQG